MNKFRGVEKETWGEKLVNGTSPKLKPKTQKFKFIMWVRFTISNTKQNIDSGCLKHMIVDSNLFSSFTRKNGGFISYYDNYNEDRRLSHD